MSKHFNPMESLDNPHVSVRPGDRFHTLQGFIHRETERAILFEPHQLNGSPLEVDPKPARHWFPISQCRSITRAAPVPPDDDTGEIEYDNLTVKEWLLKEKGIM